MNALSPSVLELTRKNAGIWRSLPAEISDGMGYFSEAEQSKRERRIEELIRDVERSGSPSAARNAVRRFVSEAEGIGSLVGHSDDFSAASRQFVRQAREFDRDICEREIQQALRNLWVFHALQLLFAGRVAFQPGAFAYSLLYPYTDNFFDDPGASITLKRTFGGWISRRLSGDFPDASDGVAGKVHRLLGLIEEEYPRSRYPLVYEGLHAIHDAQMGALRVLPDNDVQGIEWRSVRKGGTSVLADALLVRGRLQPHETEFSFRLGVLLQFIDDLQDGRDDGREGAATLFSAGRTRADLREAACRLLNFLGATFGPGALPDSGEARAIADLMRRSCIALTCEAVYRQADRFDSRLVESIVPLCPVHPRYLASLHERTPALSRRFPAGIRSILIAAD